MQNYELKDPGGKREWQEMSLKANISKHLLQFSDATNCNKTNFIF